MSAKYDCAIVEFPDGRREHHTNVAYISLRQGRGTRGVVLILHNGDEVVIPGAIGVGKTDRLLPLEIFMPR